MSPTRKWGPVSSILVLLPVLFFVPWYTQKRHYELPAPLGPKMNPETGLPQLSEEAILGIAEHLSEGIGFRTVGTREHALADEWMFNTARSLQAECERVVKGTGRKLECEVWHQVGSGSHRFDMMDKRVYKTYVGLTNIVMRLSNGTPEGKEHAVLVNAHLDSTLPSPGAGDDAVPVGVMVECIRVLTQTPEWEPNHAIIFLWNHAEESLQDGSQLFSTQHEIAKTVRAVINLEAAGTTGPELLFQATSEAMIQAYAHVPRPYGTVIANEVFSSGIIMSDTDFRQFQHYLNVTGLDMAIVGNSYLYHTRKDLVKYMEPGVAQHMAENTLALLKHLSSEESPLPTLSTYTRPTTVFFSLLGTYFITYSFDTANKLHLALLTASAILFTTTFDAKRWNVYPRALFGILGGLVGALVGANTVAYVMVQVLDKSLSWYSSERLCLYLYGPPALAGALISQLFVSYRLSPTAAPALEHASLSTLLALLLGGTMLLQSVGLGSATLFFQLAVSFFLSLLFNAGLCVANGQPWSSIHLSTYVIASIFPMLIGTEVILALTDFFVPLTGRMGGEAPAEHIIASIVASVGFYSAPMVLPFSHRFGRRLLEIAIVGLCLLTVVSMAIFSLPSWAPFDPMHQKRFFALHVENITSGEFHLHVGAADSAPGFEALVHDLADQFAEPSSIMDELPSSIIMNDHNPDWDMLYPFSQFVTPYKLQLPSPSGYVSPWASGEKFTVTATRDVIDRIERTRTLTLSIRHPGVIWTVIAFDAEVLEWSLDDSPPAGYTRHHIKEASFYGIDTWTVDLVLRLPEDDPTGRLVINFDGVLERGMWPGKKAEREGPAMDLFEELDAWLDEETGGTVDAMLLGSVAGVAFI